MEVEILRQKGHRFLWVDGYLWMWDLPVERKAQKEVADKAHGEVLVAGYGLGLVQQYLTENPKVKSVLSLEISNNVIEAVKEEYGRLYGEVEIGDFYKFNSGREFDYVIGDVWEDLVAESLPEYQKFKAKAQTLLKPNGKILAWGQDFFEYMLNGGGR